MAKIKLIKLEDGTHAPVEEGDLISGDLIEEIEGEKITGEIPKEATPISEEDDNIIESKDDGLYAPGTHLEETPTIAVEGDGSEEDPYQMHLGVTTDLTKKEYEDGYVKENAVGSEGTPMDWEDLDVRKLPPGTYAVNVEAASGSNYPGSGEAYDPDDVEWESGKLPIKNDMASSGDLSWRSDGRQMRQVIDVKMSRNTNTGKLDQMWAEGVYRAKSSGNMLRGFTTTVSGKSTVWVEYWTNDNAKPDSDGFLKESSPLLRVSKDGIVRNDYDGEVTLDRKEKGVYVIKGTTGLRGGSWDISTPSDHNGNKLLFVECDDDGGDITLKTFKAKYEGGANTKGDPTDIPDGREVVLRMNDELYDEADDSEE